MAVYKFRVTFEDFEDVSRDIEIVSSQTFADFHTCILKSIGFDAKHAASFFVSDDYWRKNAEITLLEEDVEPGVKLMKNTKVSSCISQPNQRFVYLYDINVRWTLMVELIKLVPEDAKAEYPRCVKTNGQAPKQYKLQIEKEKKKETPLINGVDEAEDDDEIEEPSNKIIDEEKLEFDEDENDNLHDDTEGEDQEEGEEGNEEDDDGHDDHQGFDDEH